MRSRWFETWETAVYFAFWTARRHGIRTRVRRHRTMLGLDVWRVDAA